MTDVYEDTGSHKSDPETNKAIRELLVGEIKISTIEKKSIDKPTFLTAAAILFGAYSNLGPESPSKKLKGVLEKIANTGYPIKPFENMDLKECLNYLRFLYNNMESQLSNKDYS